MKAISLLLRGGVKFKSSIECFLYFWFVKMVRFNIGGRDTGDLKSFIVFWYYIRDWRFGMAWNEEFD